MASPAYRRAPTCRECGHGTMTLAGDGRLTCPDCGAVMEPWQA